MEEVSLGKGRFNDQFAIVGRLHQLKQSVQALETSAMAVTNMFTEGVNDESHTPFLWHATLAQDECTDIKKAVEDIKYLLREMKKNIMGKEQK